MFGFGLNDSEYAFKADYIRGGNGFFCSSAYANGDWSHSYVCDSGDELQKLSESIQTMATNTQGYITSLNELARTDGLTGIRNKTSYLEFVDEIKLNRHRKYDHYALVVMDVNLLKKTNDTYGHEAGDLLLGVCSQ